MSNSTTKKSKPTSSSVSSLLSESDQKLAHLLLEANLSESELKEVVQATYPHLNEAQVNEFMTGLAALGKAAAGKAGQALTKLGDKAKTFFGGAMDIYQSAEQIEFMEKSLIPKMKALGDKAAADLMKLFTQAKADKAKSQESSQSVRTFYYTLANQAFESLEGLKAQLAQKQGKGQQQPGQQQAPAAQQAPAQQGQTGQQPAAGGRDTVVDRMPGLMREASKRSSKK